MAHWYVKDLAKLTGVSVQTLHHYDRIGLLTPTLRGENGYRVYSETDLLKLQQIIALKFFGFELSHIKTLLKGDVNVTEHFALQAQFLAEKAKTLLEASQTLQRILSDCGPDTSIPWKTIIELIEVYHMTQELEKTWVSKVLTPEELKEYAAFQAGLKTRFTEAEAEAYRKKWTDLLAEVETNLEKDPTSDFGVAIGKRSMDWVNGLYGVEHATLRTSIWEKGFQKNKMDAEHAISPAVITWLDKAMDTYWRKRIYGLLDRVGKEDDMTLRRQWNALMTEMYGNDQAGKQALIEAAMTDDKVSAAARKWLKQ